MIDFSLKNRNGPVLSVEQITFVGNLNLVSNRDYNHDDIVRIY